MKASDSGESGINIPEITQVPTGPNWNYGRNDLEWANTSTGLPDDEGSGEKVIGRPIQPNQSEYAGFNLPDASLERWQRRTSRKIGSAALGATLDGIAQLLPDTYKQYAHGIASGLFAYAFRFETEK